MITLPKVQSFLNLGKCLTIVFLGLPYKNTKRVGVYRYSDKRWTLQGNRLTCDGMDIKGRQYSRSIRKIAMVLKGNELLYGRRCRSCGAAIPKSHGNCFDCYSESIETVS